MCNIVEGERERAYALAPFTFFYLRLFFRIVTFQWVTADSNKKNPPRLWRPLKDQVYRILLLHLRSGRLRACQSG